MHKTLRLAEQIIREIDAEKHDQTATGDYATIGRKPSKEHDFIAGSDFVYLFGGGLLAICRGGGNDGRCSG
jgi:hypothetical protein